MKIAGVVLLLAGIAAIFYGGFSYTDHRDAVAMGPVQIKVAVEHSVPIPPILGIAAILGSGVLVYLGTRQGR